MQDLLNAFQLKGKPLFCQRFGEGHINETYLRRSTPTPLRTRWA